jgi:hypothetical protein
MENFEDATNDEPIVIEKNKKIVSQPSNVAIQTLYQWFKDGDLILAPDFQRRYVWDKKKASALIESIILNVPLPQLFTARDKNREEVIDGQQRLTSIFSFIDGIFPDGSNFKLHKNLRVLGEEIGGKTYSELEKEYKRAINKYALTIISITEESNDDIKFEMFERLNTNITPLTSQELRNCMFRGKYNDFIKRLADYPDFEYIINSPEKKKRMYDVELVLMFCSFHNTSYDQYSKSLAQWLNQDMRENSSISDERLDRIEKNYKKSVKLIKRIWDKKAFNIFSVDAETNTGSFSTQFNQGLFQILMQGFLPYDDNQVMPYTDLIREELLNLLIHNIEFRETLTGSGTNSPKNIRKKFDIWRNTLNGILKYPKAESRSFSYQLKDELFRQNQTCQLCNQRISSPDDAEIDHIICYWKGGRTIPENARLTHRLCNRKRGANDDFNFGDHEKKTSN